MIFEQQNYNLKNYPLKMTSNDCGYLIIIHGSMFSGKTTTLLGKLSAYTSLDKKILYVNSSKDTRKNNPFSTHNIFLNQEIVASIDYLKSDNSDANFYETLKKYDIIGIDEAQFFSDDLFNTVLKLVENDKKIILLSGLLLTAERKEFGIMNKLIPFADEVIHLKGFCNDCSKHGTQSLALFCYNINGKNKAIEIGGSDKYLVLCRECYVKHST